MKIRQKMMCSSVAAAMAVMAGPAWAQTKPSDEIEVVKVTAQKRKEDPAKVAMSITAVAGPGTENIEIRGISSTAGAATVGIYLGETLVSGGKIEAVKLAEAEIEVSLFVKNERGEVTSPGRAVVRLRR